MISPIGLDHADGYLQRFHRTTSQCSDMPSLILQNRQLSNPDWYSTRWTAILGSLAPSMKRPAVRPSHSPRDSAVPSVPNMVLGNRLRHSLASLATGHDFDTIFSSSHIFLITFVVRLKMNPIEHPILGVLTYEKEINWSSPNTSMMAPFLLSLDKCNDVDSLVTFRRPNLI